MAKQLPGGKGDCLWYKMPLAVSQEAGTERESPRDAQNPNQACVWQPLLSQRSVTHKIMLCRAQVHCSPMQRVTEQLQAQGGRLRPLVPCLGQEGVLLSLHLGHHLILCLQGNNPPQQACTLAASMCLCCNNAWRVLSETTTLGAWQPSALCRHAISQTVGSPAAATACHQTALLTQSSLPSAHV